MLSEHGIEALEPVDLEFEPTHSHVIFGEITYPAASVSFSLSKFSMTKVSAECRNHIMGVTHTDGLHMFFSFLLPAG